MHVDYWAKVRLWLKGLLRPTFGKVIGTVVVICIIGWLSTEAAIEQQKADGAARVALRDRNMDVRMGHWHEAIRETIKRSGACQLRGHFCAADGPGGTWYWKRESVRGPDILDVIIPTIFNEGKGGVRLSLFMRDKSGNVAAATPQLVQVLDQVLALLKVSPAAAARCKAMAEPRPFTDGQLKLSCQKRLNAAYQARDGSGVEGSSWTMSIENLE